ncbi:MAG TPA: nucleotide disphospho-sugar-binding domain-containing protein [Solirubrobacterales bacterium]|nr:nucleotide disphospho-sugar-binding domain-containing protein [Solirubrobacterales bacterium]
MRVVIAAVGWTGHAFPAISLARALRGRGHGVWVETFERWRGVIEELGLGFLPARERIGFASADAGGDAPGLAAAARELGPVLGDIGADAVVADMFTLAPALAADVAGVPRATLIPHPYPVREPGLPLYPLGLLPPRSAAGALGWRVAWSAAGTRLPATRLGRVRAELDAVRADLGLPPLGGYDGQISERLALVATFPQLEYPRHWPAHVHVTGPMPFELDHQPVELPAAGGPLVVVAASTERDPDMRLISTALEALAEEPVRVIASANRAGALVPEAPANARVHEWVSYSQVLPDAALVVCHGGHGTVARALAAGVPVLIVPPAGDMAENGARVTWAGAGLMLPNRLLAPSSLRAVVRRLLGEDRFAGRAREIGAWARENDGAAAGAALVEGLAP